MLSASVVAGQEALGAGGTGGGRGAALLLVVVESAGRDLVAVAMPMGAAVLLEVVIEYSGVEDKNGMSGAGCAEARLSSRAGRKGAER